LNQLV